MSITTIYGFNKQGSAFEAGAIQNSWRAAMAVWSELEARRLPPYVPYYLKSCNWYRDGMPYDELVEWNGFKPTRLAPTLGKDNPAQEIFDLADDPTVPRDERIVLYTTFNKVLVKREHFREVINAFRAFGGTTSLPEQADILELLRDDDCIAAGWSQNDICGSFWDAYNYDEETGSHSPYNCLTQEEHSWLFSELDSPTSSDEFLEGKWAELADLPFDDPAPDSDWVLAVDWWAFKAGTKREDIWHFFDDHHSKGIVYLMHLD